MNEFVYTDRYENTLYNLLIWWGTLLPSPFPEGEEGELICGTTCDAPLLPYTIESYSTSLPRLEDCQIQIIFHDHLAGVKTLLEPGDKIVFDEEAMTLTLIRE